MLLVFYFWYNLIKMKDKQNSFERELNIYEDNYSFTKDSKGNCIEICIYDNDYSASSLNGDSVIDVLSEYAHLKSIEISMADCLINDISKLSKLKELENFHLECPSTISDLSAFADLPNIKSICISDAKISDLSPLKNCVKLESLILFNNAIKDISCLENLTELKNLIIGGNKIEDLSVIEKFKKLQGVGLYNNNSKDLSALKSLKDISYIDIRNNKITDLEFLNGKANLSSLNFDNNLVDSCEVLSNHKKLVYLSFENNQITNLSPIDDLESLRSLLLSNNPIADFSPIFSCKKLEFLKANNITINTLKGFENLTELRYLYLNNCNISNVSFLDKNIKIQNLMLNDNSIKSVLPLVKLTNIRNLGLRNNKLNDVFPLHLFCELDALDLRDNKFGNQLFVKYAGYISILGNDDNQLTFIELIDVIGLYYLEKGEFDKALAFCYLELESRNKLVIYSKKFIETDENDYYYLDYYFSKCLQTINALRNKGELDSIHDLIENIKSKIGSLKIITKDEFTECIENSKFFNYNAFVEYYEYFDKNSLAKINPEILYFLGKGLCTRENMMKSLSLYKELKIINHPLSNRLYQKMRYCLDMNFAYTESERNEHDKFRTLLDNIEEASIPDFDYMTYLRENNKRYSYSYNHTKEIYKGKNIDSIETKTQITFSERFEILILLSIIVFCVLGLLYVIIMLLTFS